MGNERTVQITSRIVTVINILETVACAFAALGGLAIVTGLEEYFAKEPVNGSSDVGNVVAGVGGIFGAIIGYILLFVGISGFIYYLIPTIKGIVTWVQTKKKLEEGPVEYFRTYKKDGITKLVFNGLPIVLSAGDIISDLNHLEMEQIIVSLLFMIIPAISVYQIIISIDGGKQE